MDASKTENNKNSADSAHHPIPLVHQYGDQDSSRSFGADLLHCETLSLRSRQHQFKIRPHRHQGLTQIFLINHGSGQAVIDGQRSDIQAPAALIVAELCVHDFLWSQDVEGYVLSLSHALLEQLSKHSAATIFRQTRVLNQQSGIQELNELMQALHQEYNHSGDEHRAAALSNRVQLLAIALARQAQDNQTLPGTEQSRGLHWLQRFNQLINRDYALQRSVEDYATELGISAAHLNAICQTQTQRNALSLIHERVLLEACRCLTYTVQPVSAIAYQLGYNDPAYFTRFFRRHTGLSPRQFRIKAEGEHSVRPLQV